MLWQHAKIDLPARICQHTTSQFLEARDWPFGMVMMLVGTLVYFRSTAREY
jgi:hypothetical protein